MSSMRAALFIITCITLLWPSIDSSDDEYRLIHYLFAEQDYNPLIRPTMYSNETLVVSFGLLLVQIIHVRMYGQWSALLQRCLSIQVFEKEQVMKTNTWLHMKWSVRIREQWCK